VTPRTEFRPDSADDKWLLQRISELVSTRAAIERELAACVNEYSRRRISLARAGKPIQGPLAEPIAPSEGFQLDQARRESLAAQHFEADEEARRNPHTSALFR
jgi:hypothetical protein